MPEKIEKFSDLFKNKNIRNVIILIILSVILVSIVAFQLTNVKEKAPEGAERVIMCTKCSNVETRRIKTIKDQGCSKCKGRMGYAYKCKECEFEFPVYIQYRYGKLSKKDILKNQLQEHACPNCSSSATKTISVK